MSFPNIICFTTVKPDESIKQIISHRNNIKYVDNMDGSIDYEKYFGEKQYIYEAFIIYDEATNKSQNVKIVDIYSKDFFLCNIKSLYTIVSNIYVENFRFVEFKAYTEDLGGIYNKGS